MNETTEFISPYFLLWFIIGYLDFSIWMHIVTSVRQNKSKQIVRLVLFIIFLFFSFMEFMAFNQMIRTSQRYDFGFWFSIFFPTIVIYFILCRLIYGVYRSLRHKFLRNKSLRAFKKYHFCIPLIELMFAFAYSSFIGIFASILNFAATYFVDKSIPKRKKVRKQRKQV